MFIEKEFLSNHLPISKMQSITANILIVFLIIFMITSACDTQPSDEAASKNHWVGTWNTAPQLVEPRNMPPEPGLTNNTLRQVVCVSIGGDKIRVRFSNEFSTSPVTMKSVHIAVSKGKSTIDSTTDLALTFDGKTDVIIEPGKAIASDPFDFSLKPRTNLAVTIYFGDTAPDVTGHPGSRTTSFIAAGNEVSEAELSSAVKTDHWYIINGIVVIAPKETAAVVIIGNSITDGRGSGTNKQNRWPDELAKRLLKNPETQYVAVLNQGIGGNCVLKQCLGPSALDRFERDVINQSGVRWLIIFEGINDIGGSRGSDAAMKVAGDLIAAYDMMIDSAKARGISVYGTTLLPFGGSFYDSPDHE
ncbi:MAG: GDSL-type esterase/lipase family protein, partial [Calditrichaceae bacterium]